MKNRIRQIPSLRSAATLLFLALLLTIGMAPASTGVLYDNGPHGDNPGGVGINYSTTTTDSFILSSAANVTGVTFFVREEFEAQSGGNPVTSVDWSITSGAFSGATYGSGTAATTDAFLSSFNPGHGFEVLRSESFSIPIAGLSPGTYWLQLANAVASDGKPLDWDVNSGASLADVMIPSGSIFSESSEAFQILGDENTGTPEPGSFGLLAAGVLGMAGLLRRRTAR